MLLRFDASDSGFGLIWLLILFGFVYLFWFVVGWFVLCGVVFGWGLWCGLGCVG